MVAACAVGRVLGEEQVAACDERECGVPDRTAVVACRQTLRCVAACCSVSQRAALRRIIAAARRAAFATGCATRVLRKRPHVAAWPAAMIDGSIA
jgi:hypothetical protein